MNITAEEKLMYQVMKAIYESGIPMSFKGSMVMKAGLMEAGYPEDTRHTVDIDANWNSTTPPSAEQMTQSLKNALTESGISLEVRLYGVFGSATETAVRNFQASHGLSVDGIAGSGTKGALWSAASNTIIQHGK